MKLHRSSYLKYYENVLKTLKKRQKNAILSAFNLDYNLDQNTMHTVSELELCISAIDNIIAEEENNE